jgi:hypothetical protein
LRWHAHQTIKNQGGVQANEPQDESLSPVIILMFIPFHIMELGFSFLHCLFRGLYIQNRKQKPKSDPLFMTVITEAIFGRKNFGFQFAVSDPFFIIKHPAIIQVFSLFFPI